MFTNTKRYFISLTTEEKAKIITLLQNNGLSNESIRKYSLVNGIFPIKYWRLLNDNSTLSFENLYSDWEHKKENLK